MIDTPATGLAYCLAGTVAVEIASSTNVTVQRLGISGYDSTGVRVRHRENAGQ